LRFPGNLGRLEDAERRVERTIDDQDVFQRAAPINLGSSRPRDHLNIVLKLFFENERLSNGASRNHHHIRWCGNSVSVRQYADTTAGQDGNLVAALRRFSSEQTDGILCTCAEQSIQFE
jgi:hypothetical protein